LHSRSLNDSVSRSKNPAGDFFAGPAKGLETGRSSSTEAQPDNHTHKSNNSDSRDSFMARHRLASIMLLAEIAKSVGAPGGI
jgi:hypothetical protein